MRIVLIAIALCAASATARADDGPVEMGAAAGIAMPTAEQRSNHDGQLMPSLGAFAGYGLVWGSVRIEPGVAAAYSRFSSEAFRGSWLLLTPRLRIGFLHDGFESFFDVGIGYGRTTSQFRGNPSEPWQDHDPKTFGQAYSVGAGVNVAVAGLRVGGRISMEGPQIAQSGFVLYGLHQIGVTAFVAKRFGAQVTGAVAAPSPVGRWFAGPAFTAGWLEPQGCEGYCRGTPVFGVGGSGGWFVARRIAITGSFWGHVGDRENMQLFAGPGIEYDAGPLWARASAGVGYRNHHDADGTPQSSTGLAFGLELGRGLATAGRRTTELVVRAGYHPGEYTTTISVTAGIGVRWR